MNILHITNGDGQYGSALALMELIDRELSEGITPIVLSPRYNELIEHCIEKNIKHYVFFYEWSQIPKHNAAPVFALKYIFRFFSYLINNPKAERHIEKILIDDAIDIVHTNNMVIDVGMKAAGRLSVPHVWHLRELLKENYNCYPIKKNYIKKLNDSAGSFIAVSEFVKKSWVAEGIDDKRISVIYDGIDGNLFGEKSKSDDACGANSESERVNIVMCGSFCTAKNQKQLVEAVSLLGDAERKRVHVALYGRKQGQYYEETVGMIKEKGLQQCIEIMGYCENIPEELKKYDCGIMCSSNEAFGRVTIEYMMAGLCTVATDAGANREVTDDGKKALLYNADSAEHLADIIRMLIADRDKMIRLGRNGREWAESRFDINKNVPALFELFDQLISEKNRTVIRYLSC